MNDCSVPAGGPRERMSRRMYGLSLFCVFAGLAVMIVDFIVRSASVVDEMSASMNLVIPGNSAVMSDGEFIRSLLPVVGASGIVHLVGVIAGLVGRARARGAQGARALRVGSGCECLLPCLCLYYSRAGYCWRSGRSRPPPRRVRRCGPGRVRLPIRASLSQRGREVGGCGARGHTGDGRGADCWPVRDASRPRDGAGGSVLAHADRRGRLLLHVRPGGPRPTRGLDHGNTSASAR